MLHGKTMPFPLKTGILTTDNTEDTENTEKDRKDFRQKNEGQKNREEINKPRITRKTRIREDKYPPRPLSFCSIIFLPFYFSVFHPCFHPCFLRGPFSSLFFAPLRLCAKSQSSPPHPCYPWSNLSFKTAKPQAASKSSCSFIFLSLYFSV